MSNLGPHGEGYCTVCRFIEPLTPSGYLAAHRHDRGGKPCKGSGRRPGVHTPFFSRRSAFRTMGTEVTCPACGWTGHSQSAGDMAVYPFHASPQTFGLRLPQRCDQSHRKVEPVTGG